MNADLLKALEDPEIDTILMKAAIHADTWIRKFIWRGFRPQFSTANEATPTDKSAKDFVNEALLRLCNGKRAYDPRRSLLENLNSITDSLISTEKKASDRTPLVDHIDQKNGEESPKDPISLAASKIEPDQVEISLAQNQCFESLLGSLDGDRDMREYLLAMKEEFFKPVDIAEVTGIPVAKVYELRRKVKKHAEMLFGVQNYAQLERNIKEG
jgi:DNA-directed RNA polymerase specialized sigma24 family protein